MSVLENDIKKFWVDLRFVKDFRCIKCGIDGAHLTRFICDNVIRDGYTAVEEDLLQKKCSNCGYMFYMWCEDHIKPESPPTFEEEAAQEVEALLITVTVK